ncbi:MAG: YciI family protein [Gaiellales bacterium]
MFLLLGRYTAPLDEVDPLRDGHVAWVQEHVAAGHFLAGALEEGGVGGAIVAKAASREELEAWTRDDPFIAHGVFAYDIRGYEVAFTTPGVEGLAD